MLYLSVCVVVLNDRDKIHSGHGHATGIFLDPPRGVYTPDFQSTPLQFKKKNTPPPWGVINY